MRLSRFCAVAALFSASLSLSGPAEAAGDLLVAPTRLVMEGARGTEVILNNIDSEPATYRISLELKRMRPDGGFEDVTPENANAAEKAALAMISYAPRKVLLPPNQPQSIRVGIRPPVDLPDGEYRAHMLFRAIPAPRAATAPSAAPVTGVSISLTPIYGVTIPVIFRKGSLSAKAAITGAQMIVADGNPALQLSMTRQGTRSTYGRILVLKSGQSKPVYESGGISVYAELNARKVTLPVAPDAVPLMKGPVTIQYREEVGAGGGLIAEYQAVLR
jgi:hypothetical protein